MAQNPVVASILEQARKELLDLTARNRLLNTPRKSKRSSRLEIVGESSNQVFQHLTSGKSMSFLHDERLDSEDEDVDPLEEQPLADQTDDKLQTALSSEKLQQRLLKLFYDARTFEEEQGVNVLYLAIGFLKWYEDDKSKKERHAPLILLPVTLKRASASARFRLRWSEEELVTNLTLQARLKADFGIDLPELPDTDDWTPSDYFEQVKEVIKEQSRWQVLTDDIVLWFFSFSKYLMYRDLQPDNWPEGQRLEEHPLIQSLFVDGFPDDISLCDDDDRIDELIPPREQVHILDADSSQALVIEEVARGRNLVIQGPPGTGKSQTIANLIAAAVKQGKTVLFVAEKMAALEVVERRLRSIHLEDICLELHSHKANKRAVLQVLANTLNLGKPQLGDVNKHCQTLNETLEQLNHYLDLIHTPIEPHQYTPFQIVGDLVRVRSENTTLPAFSLDHPEQWTRQQWQERHQRLIELAEHAKRVEDIQAHPWRGVGLEMVMPTDVDRIQSSIKRMSQCLKQLIHSGEQVAEPLGMNDPKTLQEFAKVIQTVRHLTKAPPMDRKSLANEVWATDRQQIEELVSHGANWATCRKRFVGKVHDQTWATDLTTTRVALRQYGKSWFRIFYRDYRQAKATLRAIFVDRPPRPLEERLHLVDLLIDGQRSLNKLKSEEYTSLGQQAFGSDWHGEQSDWNALKKILQWEKQGHELELLSTFRHMMTLVDSKALQKLLQSLDEQFKTTQEQLERVFQTLQLNLIEAFQQETFETIPLSELMQRLADWQASSSKLSQWVHYATRRRQLANEGMADLMQALHDGRIESDSLVSHGELLYFDAIIREAYRLHPELANFHGSDHEQVRKQFCELDQARIQLARQEVADAHYRRLPSSNSNVGEVGLIRREIEKKRRHLAIRALLSQAGKAVQAIKPVFLMSPISVANYLEPGKLEFDLLLIDEASQVQPVDALGAIARCKQIVVVGDSKQLPPTQFFSRMLDDEEAEEDQRILGEMESILSLCCARNVAQRMLRWHYRSRHHSLIAVSNREFYENRLYVVPSPSEPAEDQGLIFQYVSDGVFDRGGTAINAVEAQEVAQAVMDHARQSPHRSLGVGTFSVSQRDAVLDELELLRRADTSLESFFASDGDEPFFVKNLENIQGDERDTIFISVGYARDENGKIHMNFGPLSKDGGERRLNVLISRSRHCCQVFSSIKSEDIDLSRGRSQGARALKTFLKYAEHGLLDTENPPTGEHDSEFERQVAQALTKEGYDCHAQVGVAGFFIDLSIVDPELPGRYLLGVECDGASYHSSRSARDRDRIRQAVLEDRGWTIHRIWSSDWFHRPEEELQRVLTAIEQARIQTPSPISEPTTDEEIVVREQDDQEDTLSQPYQMASFDVDTSKEIHQLTLKKLAKILVKIVEIESPIHQEEIARRVTQLWNLQRTGSRIQNAVNKALDHLQRSSKIAMEGEFYSRNDQEDVPIRNRQDCDNGLRKPDRIPPAEIRRAILLIVERNIGVEWEATIVEVARLFGFRSTSSQLRQVIESQINALLDQRLLTIDESKLHLGPELSSR